MEKRGFLEISFAWLFALIVGAFILFLAIYFVVKFVGVEQEAQGAVSSTDIGILLNPLETGLGETKKTFLELPVETRISNGCITQGEFGKQTLSTSQMSFGKWTETGIEAVFQNKYVFSENPAEGSEFTIFVKSFEFPFKVSDLIYMLPKEKEYCFVSAPEDVTKEINDLGLESIKNVSNKINCLPESEKVCFSIGSGCSGTGYNTTVNLLTGTVTKRNIPMVFESTSLMYAAIFSDPLIYECQVKRLILRQGQLTQLYNKKALLISRNNCNSNLNLVGLINLGEGYNDSSDLRALSQASNEIRKLNDDAECKLW